MYESDKIWTNAYNNLPIVGEEIYAVIEEDIKIFYEEDRKKYYPWIDKLILVFNGENANPKYSWYIVDPLEEQEKLLQQQYTVVLWRYVN